MAWKPTTPPQWGRRPVARGVAALTLAVTLVLLTLWPLCPAMLPAEWAMAPGADRATSAFVSGVSAAGGASLRFYGNGQNDIDRVKIAIDSPTRPVNIGVGDFTIEFWMKAQAAENGSGACVAGGDGWINGNIIIDRDIYGDGDYGDFGISLAGGRIAFGVARGGSGNTICSASSVADGAWRHVAATRQASTGQLRLFIDGGLDATGTGPTGDVSYRVGRATSFSNDPFLVFGAEKHDVGPAYPSYSGWLDEVRLSRVVRYAATFARPTGPFVTDGDTVALYRFDEGGGEVITDSSGAAGGPSNGIRRPGGSPAGPLWSTDTPWEGAIPPSPTSTATATATWTMVPPTPTASPTRTPTATPPATATWTVTATATSPPLPTMTPTAPPTPTPTATLVPPPSPTPTSTPTVPPTGTATVPPTPTATSVASPTATPTVTLTGSSWSVGGRVFLDANGSGAAEANEAGSASVGVFADLNGDGQATAGEPTAVTGGDGAYLLTGMTGATARLCWRPGAGQAHTTPRCQTVAGAAGTTVSGVDFGLIASKSWCAGTVMTTVTGIDPDGEPVGFEHPTRLSGPATGAWAGTRLLAATPSTVHARTGELVANALLMADLDAALHPRLTLRFFNYQQGLRQVVAVVAADGTTAAWIAGSTLPQPAPTSFAIVDRGSDLYIYNVPLDGDTRYQDLTVITRIAGSGGSITENAAIAGKIVDGRLVSIASTCGDSAKITISGASSAPTATTTAPPPTTTPINAGTPTPTPPPPTPTPTAGSALPLPDLRLSGTDTPDPARSGQTVTYRVSVANTGAAVATATGGVVVMVETQSDLTFLSAYGTNTFGCRIITARSVQCSAPKIGAGQTAVLTIGGRAGATTGGLRVMAVVDPAAAIAEQDETNNSVLIETALSATGLAADGETTPGAHRASAGGC